MSEPLQNQMHNPHRVAGRPASGIGAERKGATPMTCARDPARQVSGSLPTPRHRAPRATARWRGGYLPHVDDYLPSERGGHLPRVDGYLPSERGGYLPRVDGYLPSERDGLPGPPPPPHADGVPRRLTRPFSLFSITCQTVQQTRPANLAALQGANSAARQILPPEKRDPALTAERVSFDRATPVASCFGCPARQARACGSPVNCREKT